MFSIFRQHETVIPGELPLGQELTSTLREWAVIWHRLYVVSLFQWLVFGGGIGRRAVPFRLKCRQLASLLKALISVCAARTCVPISALRKG